MRHAVTKTGSKMIQQLTEELAVIEEKGSVFLTMDSKESIASGHFGFTDFDARISGKPTADSREKNR